MLKIKLARFGKRSQPHYRVVVNEARDKRDGQYIVALGHYAPTQNPKLLQIDLEAYRGWVAKGAQPTETVASLVTRFESGNPFPDRPPKPSKKARAKALAAAEAAAIPAEPKEEVAAELPPVAVETATEVTATPAPAAATTDEVTKTDTSAETTT